MKKIILFIFLLNFNTVHSQNLQYYNWQRISPGLFYSDSTISQTSVVKNMIVDTMRDVIWIYGAFKGGATIYSPNLIGYNGQNFVTSNNTDTLFGQYVRSMCMYQNKIIFSSKYSVYSYDVDSQQTVALGFFPNSTYPGGLYLTEYNGDLIICGQFNSIKKPGGNWVGANSIARWDGNNWHAMGMGLWDSWGGLPSGHTMEVYHNKLYVGGTFREAGNTTAWGIASWDGSNWACVCDSASGKYGTAKEPPGNHCCGRVNDMEVFNDKLYIVGFFDSVSNIKTNLASWNDTSWTGSEYPFTANWNLGSFGSHLVVSTNQGGAEPYLWYCEGPQFPAVDSGLGLCLYSMVNFHDTLYAGGCFSLSGNTHLSRFARLLYDSTNVGFENISNSFIKLIAYPNPAQDEVKIRFSLFRVSKAAISFYDVLGREALKKEVQTHEGTNTEIISLNDLPQGIYLCEIKSSNERATVRIVKE